MGSFTSAALIGVACSEFVPAVIMLLTHTGCVFSTEYCAWLVARNKFIRSQKDLFWRWGHGPVKYAHGHIHFDMATNVGQSIDFPLPPNKIKMRLNDYDA